MKTIVKIESIFQNGTNQMLLIENKSYHSLELDLTKEYQLEIKELKSTRTIQQNRYMWSLIHEISKVNQEVEV